ncbi:MAG: hypothetical protein V7646_2595 [Pseudonocardia sp.]
MPRAAGTQSGHVIGIEPSPTMREAARRRCAGLIGQGRVRIEPGGAADTGQPDAAVDVVLAVNNVQIWPDRRAGLAELHRVLRPGGRMLLSAHQKWLPGGQAALTAAVQEAGFGEVQAWTWDPPGRGATTAEQLRRRPARWATSRQPSRPAGRPSLELGRPRAQMVLSRFCICAIWACCPVMIVCASALASPFCPPRSSVCDIWTAPV